MGDTKQFTTDSLVSYSEGFIVGDSTNGTTHYNNYDWCYPYVERWYPVYYTYWTKEPNKLEQAFKLVQKLMEKKIIKRLTLKKFIGLVNEIAQNIL